MPLEIRERQRRNDIFDDLPILRLAAADRKTHRVRLLSAVAALPAAVRGRDLPMLYEILEDWMTRPAPWADSWDRIPAVDRAQLDQYNDAFETARKIIRQMMNAFASGEANRGRYVSRIVRATDKATLLYSSGCGQPTAAQPWLAWRDHVMDAARAETDADSADERRAVAARAREAVLLLAGLMPIDAADGADPTIDDRVRAAAQLLVGIRRAKAPDGPRGPKPRFDESYRFAGAIIEYRHREGLPVAEHSRGRKPQLVPTADTTALLVTVAREWGSDISPTELGRRAGKYIRRL